MPRRLSGDLTYLQAVGCSQEEAPVAESAPRKIRDRLTVPPGIGGLDVGKCLFPLGAAGCWCWEALKHGLHSQLQGMVGLQPSPTGIERGLMSNSVGALKKDPMEAV
jgi:hypothetical protein